MKQAQTYQHRRRHYFIDAKLQGRLLWSLTILEVLLFAIAMFVIYVDMQATLEDSLYRVHQEVPRGRPLLFQELWLSLPWVIGINVLLVLYVDSQWKKAVRPIVMQLQEILIKVKRLDLRHRVVDAEAHDVLSSANEWLKKERERYSTILAVVDDLPESIDKNNNINSVQLQQQLKMLQKIISNS